MKKFKFQIDKASASKAENEFATGIFMPLNYYVIDSTLESYSVSISLKEDELYFNAYIEFFYLNERIAYFELGNIEYDSPLLERVNKFMMCLTFDRIVLINRIEIIPPFQDRALEFLDSLSRTIESIKFPYVMDILLIDSSYIKNMSEEISYDSYDTFTFDNREYIGMQTDPTIPWVVNDEFE